LSNMSTTGLSILIPIYNYDVTALVQAIYEQAVKADILFEIILIEDASTLYLTENRTVTERNNIHYSISERNIGRAATRQTLAQNAQYEWLLFLDADVMPVHDNFIGSYLEYTNNDNDVVCGGIAYQDKKPHPDHILRWTYGHKREVKTAHVRNITPYHVVSANILIKRKVFLNTNEHTTNTYGLDNYFSYNLKQQEARVIHIDNPVYHLGLEKNAQYFKKALQAVDTTVALERVGILKNNQRPLQQAYLKLEKFHADGIFNWFLKPFLNKMRNNFLGSSPNMFYFDLYRLYYYIKIKRESNA